MKQVLKLLKLDLGVSTDKRDEYFNAVLESAVLELKRKGIFVDLTSADDQMLLSDYAAWQYRKRQEDVPISNNLKRRLMNRKMRNRAGGNADE